MHHDHDMLVLAVTVQVLVTSGTVLLQQKVANETSVAILQSFNQGYLGSELTVKQHDPIPYAQQWRRHEMFVPSSAFGN